MPLHSLCSGRSWPRPANVRFKFSGPDGRRSILPQTIPSGMFPFQEVAAPTRAGRAKQSAGVCSVRCGGSAIVRQASLTAGLGAVAGLDPSAGRFEEVRWFLRKPVERLVPATQAGSGGLVGRRSVVRLNPTLLDLPHRWLSGVDHDPRLRRKRGEDMNLIGIRIRAMPDIVCDQALSVVQ